MSEHITIGDVSPRIQYLGDGLQTVFAYPFPIFEEADLKVYLGDALQVGGYAIDGEGNSTGGTVTFDEAPGNGVLVTLLREIVIERTSDFQQAGELRAKVLNDELDRLTVAVQQVEETAERAVKRAASSPSTADLTLPEPVAGKALKWNDSADGLANSAEEIDSVTAAASASAAAAATSAGNAAGSAGAAASSASGAAGSAAAAGASADEAASARDAARLWASAAEDAAVDDGVNPPGFSAFHWAQKAAEAATGLGSLVEDETPQLGGDLDTNDKKVVTVANRDLILAPHGSGDVRLEKPLDINGQGIKTDIADGSIPITPNGSGEVQPGTTNFQDAEVRRPCLKDYALLVTAKGNLGTNPTFDYSAGNIQTGNLSANVSAWSFANWPANGRYGRLEVILTQDSTPRTINWGPIQWDGGEAPDITTADSVHHLIFETLNGGSTVRAYYGGGNFATV